MSSVQNDGNLSHGGVQNISPSSVAGALSDASKPSPVSTEEDSGNSAAPTMAMATALASAKAKAPAPVLKIVQDRNAAKARYGAKVIGELLELAEKMSASDAKRLATTTLDKYKGHEEPSSFLQEDGVLEFVVETMKTELAEDEQSECDRILQKIRQVFNKADPSTAIREGLAHLKPIIEVTIVEGATKASTAVKNRTGAQKTFYVKNKRNQDDFQSQYEKIDGKNGARIFHKVEEGGASIFQPGDDLAPYRTYGFNLPAENYSFAYCTSEVT